MNIVSIYLKIYILTKKYIKTSLLLIITLNIVYIRLNKLYFIIPFKIILSSYEFLFGISIIHNLSQLILVNIINLVRKSAVSLAVEIININKKIRETYEIIKGILDKNNILTDFTKEIDKNITEIDKNIREIDKNIKDINFLDN